MVTKNAPPVAVVMRAKFVLLTHLSLIEIQAADLRGNVLYGAIRRLTVSRSCEENGGRVHGGRRLGRTTPAM